MLAVGEILQCLFCLHKKRSWSGFRKGWLKGLSIEIVPGYKEWEPGAENWGRVEMSTTIPGGERE